MTLRLDLFSGLGLYIKGLSLVLNVRSKIVQCLLSRVRSWYGRDGQRYLGMEEQGMEEQESKVKNV
jgi:hypothetical protein